MLEKNSLIIKLISNIGSLEMGTYKYNSDYDIAVLYLSNNIEEIHKYSDDNFEVTMIHVEYLYELFSNKLNRCNFIELNEAIQLLTSMHIYDPLGMCNIIKYLLLCNINFEDIKIVYKNRIDELYNFGQVNSQVNIKRFMTLLYFISSLNWIKKFNDLPPISFNVLISIIDNTKFRELIDYVLKENKIWSHEMEVSGNENHMTYKLLTVNQNQIEVLNDFLKNLVTDLVSINKSNDKIDKSVFFEIINNQLSLEIKTMSLEFKYSL